LVVGDKEQALASIKKSEVYGLKTASAIECWPSEAELHAKSEETLNKLRLKKVEWHLLGPIVSIKFTLSDGTSKQIGNTYDVDHSFEFPDDRPINAIKVRAGSDHWVQ